MKKTLFAAAIFAAASVNSFGAACTSFNGQSLATAFPTLASGCEIGSGATLWRLSNLWIETSLGTGVPNMTTSNLLVNFQEVANGFSVTYSTTGGFAFAPPQASTWKNGMWITGIGGPSADNNITGVTASYIDPSGGVNFSFRKQIQDQLGSTLAPLIVIDNFSSGFTTSGTASGSFGSSLSINDTVVFDAGKTSGGSITSYTNTFTTAIPEPMSFLLMGVGLVGIAALRRRSS